MAYYGKMKAGKPMKIKWTSCNNENFDWKMLVSSYLGAGIRACAAMRKKSMTKEQTRLELNISSLISENCTNQNTDHSQHDVLCGISSLPPAKQRLNQRLHQLTLSSMCASLNTRVSGAMCSLCIRSLLRTSMARLMRLLISLEVDCHMLGSEPFVKEARICKGRIWVWNQSGQHR